MEFNANSSFYKFNEQWGWFGWSDGPFLGDSWNYQEDLKVKHRNSYTNPEILTPYYNIGFNGVQPYIDPMAAAKDGDKGYLLYGDFNAKNYLRRFSLHVKSLNYAQWERDPREGRNVEQHSDVYAFNTIGTKKRDLTNHEEDPSARLDSWPNTEITLLDLNTQDLYYKEGSSPDGNTEDEWNAFGIDTWDPWPAPNRTYGFGQYGFSEIEGGDVKKLKRYASPVKGAPARIRRIPIYYREEPVRFNGLRGVTASGAEMVFGGDDVPVIEQVYNPENGDITFEIPDTSYKHYEEKYGIKLNYDVLMRMGEVFNKASGECPDACDIANPQPQWETGYYYALSTAPVMCPPAIEVNGEMLRKTSKNTFGAAPPSPGLGADPRGGVPSEWTPGGGYGIVVEKMGENNCPRNIQDVNTKTFHGSTTIKGQGSCKTIELDMGLYQVLGNTNSSSLYQKKDSGEYEEYLPVIDVAASNLWIGAVNEEEDCEFYQHGEADTSCSFMNRRYPNGKAEPLQYGPDETHKDGWVKYLYNTNIESFIELYKYAYSGSFDFGCIISKWKDEFGNDIYSKAESSKALQPIEEKGAVQLNLRQITGIGCIEVFKGEDVFPGCEQRNYLYISGGGGDLKVNWETAIPTGAGTGMGTGYGLLETEEGAISGSSNLIKGYYNITGSGACPTNFLELYSIKGTGCLSTYQTENTIYISGGCGPSITGDGSIFTYYDEFGVLHISGKAGESKNITGTGCISTYEIDDTIYIDSDVPNIKVNWETGLGTGYGLLETGEGTISGSSNLIKGYYNITGSGACPTNFLEFYSITGTGCINTHQESGYIYISTSLHKSTGNWPNVNYVNEESDIPNYNPSNLISGVYNYSSENECGFNYVALRSISGLCAFSQVTHENSILLGGNVTHYSANFKSNGGHLTGAVSSSDAIYNEISGTNLINQTYYVDQTPGGPGNPIWVSQGDPYYHAGQVWSVADDCYMVIDAAWVNANTYTAPDAAVSNGDPGWKQVDCPCDLNTFTEFKSITGSGLISVSDEIINNTPYLNISAPLLTGTGCTSTFRQNIDGQEYIFVSGECAPSITGTGCTTTYQIGDTIFVSGDCTTEVYVTGTGCASTFRQNIDGQEYIFVSGECAPSITGTGCTTTYQIDDTIYISGQNCFPEGGSSCDVLVGPSDNPSWKDSESLILECLGVSWKTITMCEEDGSTSCYDILVRPCSASTTTASP